MRICAWCSRPIAPSVRRDAICCSKRCRQARHRFTAAIGTTEETSTPLRLAYADPPYPGRSRRYYSDHPDYAGEVDHAALIARLSADYDGWALSTSADALQAVLPLCPTGVAVAAWHRGERPHRTATKPLSAWEPVIYHGGRSISSADPSFSAAHDASPPGEHDASRRRRTDSLIFVPTTRTTDPNRVIGAKPARFCRWLFDLLGAAPGDSFVDLYPGSRGVSRAWEAFQSSTVKSSVLPIHPGQ